MTIVGKLKISHVEKFQMSPHDRCGEKMTNIRSDYEYQPETIYIAVEQGRQFARGES